MTLVAVNTCLLLVAISCLVWTIVLQHRLHRLELRIIDMVSNLDITVAQLEHSQNACNNTVADLHGMVTTVSRAVSEPPRDLESLVAKRTTAG